MFFLTSATSVLTLKRTAFDYVAQDAPPPPSPGKQNSKEPDVAESPTAPEAAGERAMIVNAIDPVPSSRSHGTCCQRSDILYQEADYNNAGDIRPRPTKRHRRFPSSESTEDDSPVAATPAASSPLATATVCRLFDNCVFASHLLALLRCRIPGKSLLFQGPFGLPVDELRVLSRFTWTDASMTTCTNCWMRPIFHQRTAPICSSHFKMSTVCGSWCGCAQRSWNCGHTASPRPKPHRIRGSLPANT